MPAQNIPLSSAIPFGTLHRQQQSASASVHSLYSQSEGRSHPQQTPQPAGVTHTCSRNTHPSGSRNSMPSTKVTPSAGTTIKSKRSILPQASSSKPLRGKMKKISLKVLKPFKATRSSYPSLSSDPPTTPEFETWKAKAASQTSNNDASTSGSHLLLTQVEKEQDEREALFARSQEPRPSTRSSLVKYPVRSRPSLMSGGSSGDMLSIRASTTQYRTELTALGFFTGGYGDMNDRLESEFVSELGAFSSGWTETSSQRSSLSRPRSRVPCAGSLALVDSDVILDTFSTSDGHRSYSLISNDAEGNDTPILQLQQLIVDTNEAEEFDRERQDQLFFRPLDDPGARMRAAASHHRPGSEHNPDRGSNAMTPSTTASSLQTPQPSRNGDALHVVLHDGEEDMRLADEMYRRLRRTSSEAHCQDSKLQWMRTKHGHSQSYSSTGKSPWTDDKGQEDADPQSNGRRSRREAARQEAYAVRKRQDPLLKMRLALAGLAPSDLNETEEVHQSKCRTVVTRSDHRPLEEEAMEGGENDTTSDGGVPLHHHHRRNQPSMASTMTFTSRSRESSAGMIANPARLSFPIPPQRFGIPTKAEGGNVLARDTLGSGVGRSPVIEDWEVDLHHGAWKDTQHTPADVFMILDGQKVLLSRDASVRMSPVKSHKPLVVESVQDYRQDDSTRHHSHVPEFTDRLNVQQKYSVS
ncbi:hypothetical protein CBS101457_005338 [Exobasidium rhododendri]|nr:hypothetical protein CBS101457_005338 [Exobasidium rhododendri]